MGVKKCLSVFLCLVLAAALFGCNSENSKKYIAVIVKSVNSDFFHNLQRGVDSAATEYNVNITFEGPESEEDYNTQNRMILDAVENGADAILLSAIDYEKSADAVNAAARQGVKIITIDSDVHSSAVNLFIGTDNKEAGKTAAKVATDGFSEKSNIYIGIVNYLESTDNGMQREEGFREYISRVPNAQIVETVNVDSNTSSATAGAVSLLQNHPQINVLVGFNEWMTLGVGNAIKQLGLSEKVRSIGFDANVISVEMLETGEMDALLVQNPFAIGYLGVQNAVKILLGEAVDSSEIYTEVTAVTKENLFDQDIQKILFSFN